MKFLSTLLTADFVPQYTTPKEARQYLNAVVRNQGQIADSWRDHLILSLHSLRLVLDSVAVVSTCGKYVATPEERGATLSVNIRRIVKETDPEWINGPAFADAKLKFMLNRVF